jgi:uncharacterized protein (DUF983 family)
MPELRAQQAKTRPISRSVGRGIMGKCPNCGKGKLFSGYLTQVTSCQKCNEPIGRYDPGLLLALLVGLVVVLVFAVVFLGIEMAGGASPGSYLAILLPISIAVSLIALKPFKGGLIGFMWALQTSEEPQR